MDEFDYELPPSAIAQTPVEPRDAARLLVALAGEVADRQVRDLPELLAPGDLLVVNETRVLPARLRLRKPTGGEVEVLLLERDGSNGTWQALVKPSRRVAEGTVLDLDGVRVAVGERLDGGRRRVTVEGDLDAHGVLPLPPYITTPLEDPGRYQTVFARIPGSVAAPTAGLHLTKDVLARCEERGVALATVDLAVGLDTFRPVTAERPEDHEIHSERYRVPPETQAAVAAAGRVVAVGTTTVRALETWAATGEDQGRSRLFIHGTFQFRVVDVLLTNFHLPRSSLLLLLDAFAGPRWRELYGVALAGGYRFLSFGDAMLVSRR